MASSLNQKTHVKDLRVNKYRKKLTTIIPKDPIPLSQIEKPNTTVRKLIRKSFFKKSIILNLQPQVFLYYIPHLLPSLKTLIFNKSFILNKYLLMEKTQHKPNKLFAKCKHLNTLITPEKFLTSYLKPIRKLRELRDLKIGIMDTQVSKVPSMFKNLIQLQNLKLSITRGDNSIGNHDPKLFLAFFKNLVSLKNLTKLNLRIEDNMITRKNDIILEMLQGIGNSHIKEMNIKLYLRRSLNLTGFEGAITLLEKSDSLAVYGTTSNEPNSNLRSQSDIQAFQKNLTLVYLAVEKEIDLKGLLPYCTSLKALWISNEFGTVFIPEDTMISKELKIFKVLLFVASQQAKFETTMSAMVKNLKGIKLEVFDLQVVDMNFIFLKKIVDALQTMDPQSMRVFSLRIANDIRKDIVRSEAQKIKYLSSNSINQLAQSLAQLKNLEELRIHIMLGDKKSIQSIEYLLSSLNKLKELDLFINSYAPELTNFAEGLPFCFAPDKMPELISMKVNLPLGLRIDNVEGFFEKIAFLKNIKNLSITSLPLQRLTEENMDHIIKGFADIWEKFEDFNVTNSVLQRKYQESLSTKKN